MNEKAAIHLLSNEELLDRYQKEDQKIYLQELYKRYIPMVYGLCLKYLDNASDAMDAVFDIYDEMSINSSLYIIKNFHDWLYTFAKNHCLHEMRKGNSHRFSELIDDAIDFEKDKILFDGMQSSEKKEALTACLKKLTENQRKCLEYFYNGHKSYAEIVAMTGIKLAKVKSDIYTGRRSLERCIAKELKKEEEKKEDFEQQ